MSATKHLSNSDWYKKFSITFRGEEGVSLTTSLSQQPLITMSSCVCVQV